MLDQDAQIPTINSYIRTLARIASLIPPMLDGLGPARARHSLADIANHVALSDKAFRSVVQTIPMFLLREVPPVLDHVFLPWLPVARRSLAITAADKIIMIHRPILYQSFQVPAFFRTRVTCVAAAMTILQQHEAVTEEVTITLWTHSAFYVTAAMVLGLELLFREDHADDEARRLRSSLSRTAQRLKSRRCDLIAERGVALIDTVLTIEEEVVIRVMRLSLHGTSIRNTQLDVVNEMIRNNEIVTKFLALRPGTAGMEIIDTEYLQMDNELGNYTALANESMNGSEDGGIDPFFRHLFSS